jgi:hypothetical protein
MIDDEESRLRSEEIRAMHQDFRRKREERMREED